MAGSVVILRWLSAWQPIPNAADQRAGESRCPHVRRGAVLALVSGLLFGIVPVRQVMKVDPCRQFGQDRAATAGHSRLNLRDVLLAVQIAICAVLVTSSLVAVRGMARSMHSEFGFIRRML